MLFLRKRARLRKSVQMGLFEAPAHVEGHVRGGQFIAGYESHRKKAPPKVTVKKRRAAAPKPESDAVDTKTAQDEAVGRDPGDAAVPEKPGKNHVSAALPGNDPTADRVKAPLPTPGPEVPVPPPSELADLAANTASTFGVADDVAPAQRRAWNAEALTLLQTRGDAPLTAEQKAVLARYSGRGGIGDSLNEYYTRPDVAAGIWAAIARLGFPPGEVLEPSCGTGVFMHTAPAGIKVVGNELDPTSATIARLLHVRHELNQSSFENLANQDTRLFAAVVGNPPFGLRGSFLADDKPDIPKAEQYFLDTALDKTQAGGLVALVLPTGILDASSASSFRRRLLCKGQFLGAMRLPNTAFEHADTEVTTDVVFFRRRSPDVAQALLTLDDGQLAGLGVLDPEFEQGNYFEGRGAGNILGQMEAGWRAKAGMGDDITVTGSMAGVAAAVAAFEPAAEVPPLSLADVLLPLDPWAKARATRAAMKAPYEVAQRGDTKTVDGVQYVLAGEPPRWHRMDEDVEPEHVASARQLGQSIEGFTQGQGGAGAIVQALEDWVAQHGNPRSNRDLVQRAAGDKDLHRFMSAVQPDGSFSDLLTGKRQGGEASIEATADRLSLLQGTFTAEQLRQASDGDDAAALEDMLAASDRYALAEVTSGDVDPRWQSMDQYLTGELWPKLDAVKAQLKIMADPMTQSVGWRWSPPRAKLELQAQRLEAVIAPKSLEDVEVLVNSGWVPTAALEAFFNAEVDEYLTEHPTSTWLKPISISFDKGAYTVSGGLNRATLLEKYLNRNGVREDDLPAIHTMNRDFKAWLLTSAMRDPVEELYNRSYTGFVKEAFSNEPMEVPGLDQSRGLNAYHWGGLRWALKTGKGIIAADVGVGKTPRGLILNKLLKVHGLAKKPAIVVPKSVLANWAAEINNWFPGARVMIVGESYVTGKDGQIKAVDDDQKTRDQKFHDLAQNDYDFVLLSQPVWNELDLNPVKKGEYAEDDFWAQRADALGKASDKRREKMRVAHDQALAGREFEKRSEVIYFDDLGIDALIMDEAHAYKNLYAARNRFGESPKFLGGSGLSNRALDTQFKAKYIREKNGGKNVFFLTATPTKNSPLEVYSMLAHIAPEAFERMGIRNSEEFLDRFCEFTNDLALGVDGKIEPALITSGFKNLDELREVMKRYIDRTTAADVGLKLPSRDEREHLVDMTSAQHKEYERLRGQLELGKDANGDDVHVFSIMDQMGKATLDLSLLGHADQESPKYTELAKQVKAFVPEGGQIVFCDQTKPHEAIRKALVAAGLKPSEIAIANADTAKTSLARQKISDQFNAGKLKAVITNIEEGLNLQKQTTDIHHLDIPWNAATLQQRNGRGLRQGNTKEAVRIHRYIAKGSFDGYRYQTVAAKKDWQDQLWNGGAKLENLSRATVSREDLMILMAADPEQARQAYAANKSAAEQAIAAGKRAEAGAEFVRFRAMTRSHAALKNKASASAARLQGQIERARDRLRANAQFTAPEALADATAVAMDAQSGTAYRPQTAVRVTVKNHQPFHWADGTHDFVVTGVHNTDGPDEVVLRPIGGSAVVTLEAARLTPAAQPIAYDADLDAASSAANSLDITPADVEALGLPAADAKALGPKIRGVLVQHGQDDKAWHKTAEGRARTWAKVAEAIRAVAPDADVQPLIDKADMTLALSRHGKAPDKIKSPKDLADLPRAVVEEHAELFQRHLKRLTMAYQDGNQGDYLVVGPDGKVKQVKNYDVRKLLGDHRLLLPTAVDAAAVKEAWKAAQLARTYDRRRVQTSHQHYQPGRQLGGATVHYGSHYENKHTNPLAGGKDIVGEAAFAEAAAELAVEQQAKVGVEVNEFSHVIAALLPVTDMAPYGGYAKWKPEHLRLLADKAEQRGIMDKPLRGQLPHGVPLGVLDAENSGSPDPIGDSTTVAGALMRQARADPELFARLSAFAQRVASRGY